MEMLHVDFCEELVSFENYLRPFAISLTRDTEAGKDLYQETMYRALANKEKYGVGTNVKAWLFTIMRNVFINEYHRSRKMQEARKYFADGLEMISEHAEAHLHVKEILQAIHQLPEIFRRPFELYFEGYKYHEIAHVLDEPVGTIKSRIHLGRKSLQKELER